MKKEHLAGCRLNDCHTLVCTCNNGLQLYLGFKKDNIDESLDWFGYWRVTYERGVNSFRDFWTYISR